MWYALTIRDAQVVRDRKKVGNPWCLTAVASFRQSLRCKLGCEVATQTFNDRKVTQLSGESLSRGCDVTMTSGCGRKSLHVSL